MGIDKTGRGNIQRNISYNFPELLKNMNPKSQKAQGPYRIKINVHKSEQNAKL